MSGCLPDDLIQRFVAGEVGEHVAVRLAEHLDACPHCAARVAGADDLVTVFAGVATPPMPPTLISDALRASHAPPTTRAPQLLTGAMMLAAACLLGVGLLPELSSFDAALFAHAERSLRHLLRLSEPLAEIGWAVSLATAAVAAVLAAQRRGLHRASP